MSRFSDVWIVLSLASIAGWRNWDRIEPGLSSAAAAVVEELTPAAPAAAEPSSAAEATQSVDAPLEVAPQQIDSPWMATAGSFDCSNAPPGYVIIHDFPSPACRPPVICRGY